MRYFAAAVMLVLLLVAGGVAFAWRPALAPIAPPAPGTFGQARIERGAELAAVGDCAVCHTAEGGTPYAGGRGVPTPFGVVYATNITPDAQTGIGRWSEAAFRRAMRDGIARDGAHLYPVLPYPHFTRASDADIGAIYAFLMTRRAVRATAPPNRLAPLFRQRMLLAGWNLLFLRPERWRPDPAHDAVWNRGSYLVEAVGHCGACHTPRNVLGAEDGDSRFGGGSAEDWYAPPLQAASPAREPWTTATLATYLRTGFQDRHGAAAGPMTDVSAQLARVPAADVEAMAAYVASLMPARTAEPVASRSTGRQPAALDVAGATLFDGACAGCHAADAPMTRNGAPSLALSSAVNAAVPDSVIAVMLNGIPWRDGKQAPFMPGFANALSNEQVAALAAYLRAAYTDKPAWTDVPSRVGALRRGEG